MAKVTYRGVIVEAVERRNQQVLVRSTNPVDAQKAGLAFKEVRGGVAVFEAWASERELVARDT
ncbi:MAG: hypothetical protein KC486_34575 [Myxococcales bacterium]|nr:hypothetical protein [Myxococcales bacterium]